MRSARAISHVLQAKAMKALPALERHRWVLGASHQQEWLLGARTRSTPQDDLLAKPIHGSGGFRSYRQLDNINSLNRGEAYTGTGNLTL